MFDADRIKTEGVSVETSFEIIWDFTPVFDTCKFGQDLIKNDWETVETPFFPL